MILSKSEVGEGGCLESQCLEQRDNTCYRKWQCQGTLRVNELGDHEEECC